MRAWLAAMLLLPICASATAQTSEKKGVKDIYGWVEWVIVGEDGLRLKAKLDTGATTSSLSAEDIQVIDREEDGRWVRFKVRDREKRAVAFEAPLVRHVQIRRHNGKAQRRPVVKIGMCVGDVYRERQFTLIDRTGFVYPVLIGRNYLEGHILVDSDQKNTREPNCAQSQQDGGSSEPTADDLEEE